MKESEFAVMEGTLLKWTNYFSGWQPRWFLLENGILSYFHSQEDINDGCKGSIKMSVCDVMVHPTDSTRLDLTIPGEAHFYVRAGSSQERQQWLVALGSSKACLTNGEPSTPKEEIPEEQLKSKRSELRLYCDLLMQQVHSVKSAVGGEEPVLDVEKLNEASCLLSATCDTFINTLDECMTLILSSSTKSGGDGVPPSPTRRLSSSSSKSVPWGPSPTVSRSTSLESCRSIPASPLLYNDIVMGYSPSLKSSSSTAGAISHRRPQRSRESSETVDIIGSPPEGSPVSLPELTSSVTSNGGLSPGPSPTQHPIKTFFSDMSFKHVEIGEDGSVPTTAFLQACQEILPFFDKLNQSAFKPVVIDITGNIRKVEQKQNSRPELFTSLQSMVLHEVEARQSHLSSSATVAILWLKRTFEFTRELIIEYLGDSTDVVSAVNAAYVRTLKEYHSWVVRGVFGVAVKSVPSAEDLILCIAQDPGDISKPDFLTALDTDLRLYANSIDFVLKPLHEFYTKHGLDSPEQV